MPFTLPIKDTPNNKRFEAMVAEIIDGNLFHQRHETENFVFNVIADQSITMTERGYYEEAESIGVFITHKPSGSMGFKRYDGQGSVRQFSELMPSILKGDEAAVFGSSEKLLFSMTRSKDQGSLVVGNIASLRSHGEGAISPEDVGKIAKELFKPVEEARENPEIKGIIKSIEDTLTPREKRMLEAIRKAQSELTLYSSDYKINSSFNMVSLDRLLSFDSRGGEDISQSYRAHGHPPRFSGSGDLADSLIADANERRYQKMKAVVNDARKEALLLSSLNSIPEGMTEKQVRADIERIYPVIQESCDYHQEGWNYFIGNSYQQIRNRSQILEGPMHKSIFGLGLILKDEDFKKAIDEGKSLKGPMEKLPVLNISKRTIINFLNNVSAMDRDNTKGAPFVKTETGEARASNVRMGAILSLNPDLSTIATIQSIPTKYFNDNEVTLRNAYSMPYIDLALPTAVRKVKEKEWTSPQAFQWMARITDHDDAIRLSNTVGDTERIIEDFYINTISAHAIYHSGLNIGIIEDIRHRDSPVAERLVNSMAATMPYSAILNLSAEVHKRSQELIKNGRPDGAVSWDPAIEKDYSQDGITITPIHSTIEMTLEGAELDHCVGTYSRSAMEGETFIFGVRDADGYRISTIEIGLDESEDFEIKQHFAASNSQPSEKEGEVAIAFLEKLNTGDIEFNMETNVSRSDLNKLLPIQRAEVEHGVRFSDTEVAMDALHHLKEMMPFSDPLKIIKDDLMTMRALYHDRHDIEETLDTLGDLYDQQRAMGAYSPSQ